MKKLIKINFFTYMLAADLFITQVSCSTSDRSRASAESEEAYNDFKNYVATVENHTTNATDSTSTDW